MLDTCLCFPREMEPGYCLYLPVLTMVVLQASQMAQVVVMSVSLDRFFVLESYGRSPSSMYRVHW